jgi:Tfp pilus assembly protein PilX
MLSNKRKISTEKGFALIAAILACVILFALAMLVIHLSTGDLRVSTKTVGDKKAMSAAETGIHRMIQNFDPQNLGASATANVQVDAANDPSSVYTINTPAAPTSGPVFLPMSGYAIGGGQSWGQRRYVVAVEGRNTTYNTHVDISTGVGYGPIEISTMSR